MPFGTIVSLRPSTLVTNQDSYGSWNGNAPTGGGTNQVGVVADDIDSTYVMGDADLYLVYGFGTYTLAPNERVDGILLALKMTGTPLGQGGQQASWAWGTSAGSQWWPDDNVTLGAGDALPYFGTFHPTWPGGQVIDPAHQSLLDSLQIRFHSTTATQPSNGVAHPTCALVYVQARVYVVTQPTVVVNGPNGPQGTHTPTVSWTPTMNDGMVQDFYQIKVFDLAKNPNPHWIDTVGVAIPSNAVNSPATSTATGNLPNGNYRVFVSVAKNTDNGHFWSDGTAHSDFSIADFPPAPTNVGPTGTISSSEPLFVASLQKSSFPGALNVRGRWQISDNNAFTGSLTKVFDEPNATADGGGNHSLQVTGVILGQRTWWLEAAAVDISGSAGPWSTPVQFTVSHPPTTTNPRPAPGATLPLTANIFAWTFADTEPSAFQSAFQVVIHDSVGNPFYDSGKVPTTANSVSVPFSAGGSYQWQVRVWDNEDIVGLYSPWSSFTVHAQPIVIVTAPTSPVTVFLPTINWTYTAVGGGGAQATYRVVITDDRNADAVVYDSGPKAGASTTLTPSGPAFLTNGHSYTVTVTVTDQLNATGFGQRSFLTQWAAPGTVSGVTAALQQLPNPAGVTGGAQIATLDYASVNWSPTSIGATFGYYEVDRTIIDVLDGTIIEPLVPIAHITDEGVTQFNDFDLARSVDASVQSVYVVFVYDTVRGLSAASAVQPGVFGTAADRCDVYITSNFSPDLNVAYMDKAPYEFTTLDSALIRQHQIFGRSWPQQFRAPHALGDQFSRTLLLGGADFSKTPTNRGRIVFDPLLVRIREATPYLCVTDGMGRRWYGGVTFTKGHYEAEFEAYTADVTITELSGTPTILTATQPWQP